MTTTLRMFAAAFATLAATALFPPAATAQSEQQRLVNAAEVTLGNFMRDP
jgi:hypothetical protein